MGPIPGAATLVQSAFNFQVGSKIHLWASSWPQLNTAATPAKRKNLATCDGTSPGKPRGINESPASGILRSPGGRAQIVEEISGKMGTMWRTVVIEQADDDERREILSKRRRADSVFASKRAKGLFMTPEEKAAENKKNAELKKARRKR